LAYDLDFQLQQAEKYRNRRSNHWQYRIQLAHRLVEQYSLPKLRRKSAREITVVDIGCSIGTFAIEFGRLGYRAFGVDSEPASLEVARQLCQEENVSAEFHCRDISDWSVSLPPIDVAVCFDIFEHLHDHQLGSFLSSVRRTLTAEGSLVFHTFPTEFDYLFFEKPGLRWPLLPFRSLRPERFERLVRAYAAILDAALLATSGASHRDRIKTRGHCNPTTKERLREILEHAGYHILLLESSQLYPVGERIQKQFEGQPITHRNLYGVAVPAPSS
jgi:2-polyprenyl-3-methyl-5-hydroxy-6-metoxy-1,4-benzoquinol methylase